MQERNEKRSLILSRDYSETTRSNKVIFTEIHMQTSRKKQMK